MSDLIDRYAAWLAAHAPNTAGAAHPPTSGAELAAAESELGFALPGPVRELYRWHDGGADDPERALWLTEEFGFLPLAAAREHRRTSQEIAEDTFGPDDADEYWDPQWFPIGTSWTGDLLVTDCSTGRLLVAGSEGPVASNPVWADLDALLGDLLGALEGGAPGPVVHDGWLRWAEPA